jgi:hypothetical protein
VLQAQQVLLVLLDYQDLQVVLLVLQDLLVQQETLAQLDPEVSTVLKVPQVILALQVQLDADFLVPLVLPVQQDQCQMLLVLGAQLVFQDLLVLLGPKEIHLQ